MEARLPLARALAAGHRWIVSLPLTTAIALGPTLGAAAPPKSEKLACVKASDEASRLRADGHLLASRKELLACARDACPIPVRKDCTRRLAELEDVLPSVVVAVKDGEGHDIVDVRMTIDGESYGDKLDGKAILLDPGTHEFKFEHTGWPVVREQVLVAEGVKNRVVTVKIGPPPAPPPNLYSKNESASSWGGVPLASWVLGGVGVVALGGFTVLGLGAKSRESELRTTCAPACPADDVDSLKTKVLLADLSLGIGLVALGGAAYFYVVAPSEARPPVTVGVVPLVGGVALGVNGAFR